MDGVVDSFSASASEIFAGAIQDYGRGISSAEDIRQGRCKMRIRSNYTIFGRQTPSWAS